MEEKISRDVAEREINDWLDSKKVFDSEKEDKADHIDILTDAIMNGVLIWNSEEKKLKQRLLFPIDEIEELNFEHRLNHKMLAPYLKGVSEKDSDGRMLAHIAALTKVNRGILQSLDSRDKKIAISIVIFFV